jgi:hypothetical protein
MMCWMDVRCCGVLRKKNHTRNWMSFPLSLGGKFQYVEFYIFGSRSSLTLFGADFPRASEKSRSGIRIPYLPPILVPLLYRDSTTS